MTVLRAAAIAVVALGLSGAVARADGDPASDVLLFSNVFISYSAQSKEKAVSLRAEVAAVYAHDDRIKVAVVATADDLGSVGVLFNNPDDYAHFLGQELARYYVGLLLIVMPAGFGIYDGGRSTAREEAVLGRLKISGSGADDLTRSAAGAIHQLQSAGALRSKDVLAPYVDAIPAAGHLRTPLKLTYQVFDDSGKARVDARIVAGAMHTVASWRVPLRPVTGAVYYALRWKVPGRVPPGKLRFCVTARDPAGNHSRSCGALQIT